MTTYTFESARYPKPKKLQPTPNLANGVYISLDINLSLEPDGHQPILDQIESWFADREEVVLIDHGTSDKQGNGFILLEWLECEIDPTFLEILDNDEDVDDYTTYTRELEEN